MGCIRQKLCDIFCKTIVYTGPWDILSKNLWMSKAKLLDLLEKNCGIYYGIYFSKAMAYV